MELTLEQVHQLLAHSNWANKHNDFRFTFPNLTYNGESSRYEIIEIEKEYYITLLDLGNSRIKIADISEFDLTVVLGNIHIILNKIGTINIT